MNTQAPNILYIIMLVNIQMLAMISDRKYLFIRIACISEHLLNSFEMKLNISSTCNIIFKYLICFELNMYVKVFLIIECISNS